MARYFFNTVGSDLTRDTTGEEFATVREARIEAVRFAADVLRDNPSIIWEGHDFRVEVTDGKDLMLFTVIILGTDSPALAEHNLAGLAAGKWPAPRDSNPRPSGSKPDALSN